MYLGSFKGSVKQTIQRRPATGRVVASFPLPIPTFSGEGGGREKMNLQIQSGLFQKNAEWL